MLSVQRKPNVGQVYVPHKVTAADPIVFTLRIRERDFSLELSSMITDAIIGRKFTHTAKVEGEDVILTWRIGPSEEFWLSSAWRSNGRVRRELEAVLGLARVLS